jgi:hypothetical protein
MFGSKQPFAGARRGVNARKNEKLWGMRARGISVYSGTRAETAEKSQGSAR